MCASEVSDIDTSIWQIYEDAGVVVWGIGPDDELANLTSYSQQLGLTFPVLYDPEGLEAHAKYVIDSKTTNSVYPQDWIIGADGRVKYVNTIYDPVELMAVLDAELGLN